MKPLHIHITNTGTPKVVKETAFGNCNAVFLMPSVHTISSHSCSNKKLAKAAAHLSLLWGGGHVQHKLCHERGYLHSLVQHVETEKQIKKYCLATTCFLIFLFSMSFVH